MRNFQLKLKSLLEVPGAGRIAPMEGLRAYAVVLAFFVHFFAYVSVHYLGFNPNRVSMANFEKFNVEGFDWIAYYFFRSHYGVDIFFVISGFLIGRLLLNAENFHIHNIYLKGF